MKIGCNYWASHAGTSMWSQWDEKVVREDFRLLAETGCNMVRVFPNWKDFRPIEILYVAGKEFLIHNRKIKNEFK